MRRSLLAAVFAAALGSSLFALVPSASAAPPTVNPGLAHRNVPICGAPASGSAACDAIRRDTVDHNGKVVHNSSPTGYGPSDIQSAYNLSGSSGTPTVAIVDAYDDPYAESDLATYRSVMGLPACGTGCFTKVDQNGGTHYPRANGGWAQEISLDLDMVSAACPNCKILLVEAKSASFSDLGTAVNTAAKLGATAISNSYGGSDTTNSTIRNYYDHPGIAVTASTGDSGYGVQSPASFPTVVAVGGTSLSRASNTRGWSESAWSGAGSGCSANLATYQDGTATHCQGHKANADVSAVADPNTGVAVYDSYAYQGLSGWLKFGGTSAASPIIASVYAMSGNVAGYPAAYTWQKSGGLFDVQTGSNGTCSTWVWCNAGVGWDGPTGLGTPNGTSAF